MKKNRFFTQLNTKNALHQAIISILLLSVIPSLTLLYMGAIMWFEAEPLSFHVQISVFVLILIIATSGFLILMKFPRNIIQLRAYIEEVAAGVIPDKICLLDTENSDDLRFIETGFNTILQEMRSQIDLTKRQLEVEKTLQKTISRQQQNLLEAERHRAMVQSLGAACHHIGQPASILKMRLFLLKQIANSDDELTEIEECQKDLRLILIVLDKLRAVSEFKTESYIGSKGSKDCEILAI